MSSFARLACAAAVLALSACSPITPADDDGDPVDAALFDGPVGPDAAPDAMVDPCSGSVELENYFGCLKTEWCELLQSCLGGFVDVTDCDALPLQLYDNYGDKVDAVLLTELVAEGRVQYDPAAAGQCIALIGGYECVEALAINDNPLVTCGVFTGTLNEGSDCYHSAECAGIGSRCQNLSTNCSSDMACCTGTCERAAPVNSACTDRSCEPGTYCVNGVCQSGASGSPCGGDYDCDLALYCNQDTCANDFPSGAACADDDQCPLPEVCVGPLQGQNTGVCRRSDRVGDSCHQSCVGGNLWCDQPDPTQYGSCEERPGEGQPCVGPDSDICAPAYECVNSTCQQRGAAGAACTGQADCNQGLFCSNTITGSANGVCQAPLADGAACKETEHCQSQYCNTNDICEPWPSCLP